MDNSSFTCRFLRLFEADCGIAGGKLDAGSLSSLGREGAGSGGLLFDGGRGGSGGRLLPNGGLLLDVDVGFGGRIISSDPPLDAGGSGLLDTCFITGSASTLFSLVLFSIVSFCSDARFDEFRLLKLLMLIDLAVDRGRPRFFTSFPLSSSSQPRYSINYIRFVF